MTLCGADSMAPGSLPKLCSPKRFFSECLVMIACSTQREIAFSSPMGISAGVRAQNSFPAFPRSFDSRPRDMD